MISVIVPAYNAADTINECLDALLSQTIPQTEYEVIVVNDGSSDPTRKIVERYPVKVLSQVNAGPGAARNLGVRHARGEFVLFTDADCVPAPDWIAQMMHPFQDSAVAAVKGAYRTRQTSLLARFIQLEFEERYELLSREPFVDFVDSHAAAYRKTVFLEVGGFDPHFRISEDVDLAYRLSERGARMVFNPEAIVYHRHPETLGDYWKAKFQRAYWRAKSYRQHPHKMLKDSYTPQAMKGQIAVAGLLVLFVLAGAITGFPVWLGGIQMLLFGLFAIISLPFVRKAFAKDKAVGWLAIPLLLVRAIALGMGFVLGFVVQLLPRPAWFKVEKTHLTD